MAANKDSVINAIKSNLEKKIDFSDIFLFLKEGSQYSSLYSFDSSLFFELTDFKASAGAAILSQRHSAIFLDKRYILAAGEKFRNTPIEVIPASLQNISDWISKNCTKTDFILCDNKTFSVADITTFRSKLSGFQINAFCLDDYREKSPHHANILKIPGEINKEIFIPLKKLMIKYNLDAYLFCDPCTISWFLNIRDLNTKYTPVLLCYALYTRNEQIIIFLNDLYNNFDEISKNINEIPNLKISVKKESHFKEVLKNYKIVASDFYELPAFLYTKKFTNLKDPIEKSQKTNSQIEDIKKITIFDSAALIKFLYWFYHLEKEVSEIEVAKKIFEIRAQNANFVGESFSTIAAADEHCAMVHYSPSFESNKVIENILLLDSGGQYKYGTTDITRTFLTPWFKKNFNLAKAKFIYTIILRSLIAVSIAKEKIGAKGSDFDKISRSITQRHGLQCPHSIGHGIGYMLNVHEGPFGISSGNSLALIKNILLSNEPGYYIENEFGIRLENMIFSKQENNEIYFETISLVPFDKNLIEFRMLSENEKLWLKEYHQEIYEKTSSFLYKDEKEWLLKYLSLDQ